MTTATPPSAPKSRRLSILHGIGYVTTAIVAMQLLFIAYLIVPEWWNDLQSRAARRDSTRTHVGTLAQQASGNLPEETSLLFAALPEKSGVGRDAFRIIVSPLLQSRAYVIAIEAGSGDDRKAKVDMVSVRWGKCGHAEVHRSFTLPERDYSLFAKWFDATTEDYRGSDEIWLDGTSFTFERRKDGRTTSGSGNIPSHHGQLSARLLALLKPHIAGLDIPSNPGWYIRGEETDCES